MWLKFQAGGTSGGYLQDVELKATKIEQQLAARVGLEPGGPRFQVQCALTNQPCCPYDRKSKS